MANKTHIFGELDLDLSKSPDQIFDEAFRIGEACGYFADKRNHRILVSGGDNDNAAIIFDVLGKVIRVSHFQTDDNGKIIVAPHDIEMAQ